MTDVRFIVKNWPNFRALLKAAGIMHDPSPEEAAERITGDQGSHDMPIGIYDDQVVVRFHSDRALALLLQRVKAWGRATEETQTYKWVIPATVDEKGKPVPAREKASAIVPGFKLATGVWVTMQKNPETGAWEESLPRTLVKIELA